MVLEMETGYNAPGEIEKEVRSQLEPLFSEFYAGSKMHKAYYGYLKHLRERMNRGTEILRIWNQAFKVPKLEPRAKASVDAILYLLQIELVGNGYVDMAILLLNSKGLVLHLEPDDGHRYTRHATSPEDLDSPTLTLGVKLDFLKANGLFFFGKCIDKKLRNIIAHADFEIDSDGTFFKFTDRGKKRVDLIQKHWCFVNYVFCIEKVFTEQMAKVAHPPE
jgi:hypothetical protein